MLRVDQNVGRHTRTGIRVSALTTAGAVIRLAALMRKFRRRVIVAVLRRSLIDILGPGLTHRVSAVVLNHHFLLLSPQPIGSSPQFDDWWQQLQDQRFEGP
jgi:hypothetical protein